jgi:hypothetical protein
MEGSNILINKKTDKIFRELKQVFTKEPIY